MVRHFTLTLLLVGSLGLSGCSNLVHKDSTGQYHVTKTGQGAAIGAVGGAVVGGLVGGREGALIGAGVGGVTGGAIAHTVSNN